MKPERGVAAPLLLALFVAASVATAGRTMVRVEARDYWDLYDHIPFKGSSVEIAGAVPGESYDLVVDRSEMGLVAGSGLGWQVLVDDIDTRRDEAFVDGQYRSYADHVALMRNWAASYPDICRLDSIGQTHQGNWIYGVKISGNVQVDDNRPEVLLESMHHAREWAAPEAARHFVDTLLTNYATNQGFRDYIDNTQTWVFPIINVDGYLYDYPAQRSWRRNRQPFGSSIGSDPNRSYNGVGDGDAIADWGSLVRGSRSDHRPGSDIWMGAHGRWASEVNVLADFFKTRNFVADITLHSYSELVLWPYGDGRTAPYNATLASLGQRMAALMPKLGSGTYSPGQSNTLYPTSGGSCDWMLGWAHYSGGFPCMSYVFELGTTFYQNTSHLPAIQTANFRGAYFLFQRADSIRNALRGRVPPPRLLGPDSSETGDVTLHWSPVRPDYNEPERWEIEELNGLSVIEDNFESGSGRWTLGGASLSTTQKRSGSYSVYLGTGNNVSNYAMTSDPYPVQAGDSLRYWLWYNIESNYDVTVAEVSEDGLEWFQLHDRYTGNSSGWVRRAFSLAPWVGSSVYIRFRYMTDDNTLGAGVYVDDVWPVPAFAERQVLSDVITDTLYEVSDLEVGTYWFRGRGRNAAWGWNNQGPLKEVIVTGVGVAERPGVERLRTGLTAGRNPSAGPVDLNYTLARAGNASLVVMDASGRKVRTLVSGISGPGRHSVRWDGRDDSGRRVATGVFFCRLDADETASVRVVLLD
ncbi:MAG: M14 family zinc carboxypeptidase [bacterium]